MTDKKTGKVYDTLEFLQKNNARNAAMQWHQKARTMSVGELDKNQEIKAIPADDLKKLADCWEGIREDFDFDDSMITAVITALPTVNGSRRVVEALTAVAGHLGYEVPSRVAA